jgi:hypothetical protein
LDYRLGGKEETLDQQIASVMFLATQRTPNSTNHDTRFFVMDYSARSIVFAATELVV